MITLTSGVAEEFLRNYNAINCPTSLSYNDNYCGAWLSEKTRDYGFKTWEKMAVACRKLLKISKPVKMVKVPALLAEARNFIESVQNIVGNDMSFPALAARSEKLVAKLDAAKKTR
jgi:hypothetical protein